MEYLITLLEGVVSFISPCMLPMIPLYISYFAGGKPAENKGKAFVNALCFMGGFTLVFVALGLFAASLGGLLIQYSRIVNLIGGVIVIVFGLHYLQVFQLRFLLKTKKLDYEPKELGLLSAFLFGLVFAVGWTPCVGVFLGSALTMVAAGGDGLRGVLLMLCYSLGLGIPFVVSAVLLEQLKSVFNMIKRHYGVITKVSGVFLVVVGIAMMTGQLSRLLNTLSVV